jgi:hypothetical protein
MMASFPLHQPEAVCSSFGIAAVVSGVSSCFCSSCLPVSSPVPPPDDVADRVLDVLAGGIVKASELDYVKASELVVDMVVLLLLLLLSRQ